MVRPLAPGGTDTQAVPPRAAEWQLLRLSNFSVSTLSELYIENRTPGEFFLYIFVGITCGRVVVAPGIHLYHGAVALERGARTVRISLVVRLYRPPYNVYKLSQTSCKFGGRACKVKSKNVGGNCGNGPSANRTRRNSSSSFGKLTSSCRLEPNALGRVAPSLCRTHLRMLLPQEPVEVRSSQPTDAKETVLVCIAFAISY